MVNVCCFLRLDYYLHFINLWFTVINFLFSFHYLITVLLVHRTLVQVPVKFIAVTVPVQCQVTDSRLFLIKSSKVRDPALWGGGGYVKGHGFASNWSRRLCGMNRQGHKVGI